MAFTSLSLSAPALPPELVSDATHAFVSVAVLRLDRRSGL